MAASQAKTYELLFLLKAKMDSAFANGFNSATRQMQKLEDKIKQYQNSLGKVEKYRQMEAKLKDLTEKGKGASGQADILRGRMEQLRYELGKVGISEQDLSEKTTDLGTVEKNLTSDIEEAAEEYKSLKEQVEATEEANEAFLSSTNTMISVGMLAEQMTDKLSTFTDGIKDCIEGAAELQYTMSGVGAVAGATDAETEALTATAKELGATTRYTASEVAEAMESTALAGWSVTQMTDGMEAVTKLAAASGEDLTEMASIVSDALNAFGLSGESAVNDFADTLTKAATSSNTTVSLMGESLSYVESTAGNLGYTIQDVSTVLAVMANNALKGSVSGSSLNTMLTRMSGANTTAAKEMERLGLSMYDDNEEAKDLIGFMTELRERFNDGSMSAQEMQTSAYRLAGQRGMRGLLAIVNSSDEAWQQMISDVNDFEGAASDISDTRLDNFTGQVYLMTSAWDALKTTIGEGFLPAAQDGASVITDILTGINDFIQVHPAAEAAIIGITGAIGGLMAVGTVGSALGSLAMGAQLLGGVVGLESVGWLSSLASLLPTIVAAAPELLAVGAGVGVIAAGVAAIAASAPDASDEVQSLTEDMSSLNESLGAGDYDDSSVENRLDRMTTLKEQIASAREEVEDAQRKYDAIKNNPDNYVETEWGDRGYTAQAEADMDALRSSISSTNSAIAEAEAEYTELCGDAELAAYRMSQMGAAAEASSELTDEQLEELTSGVEAYQAAWESAYEEAASGLESQIGLMEEATEVAETSTSDMLANLESQQQKLSDYASNLQTIFDSGLDVSSIYDDITSGSDDAIAAAAAIASDIENNSGNNTIQLINAQESVNATMESVKAEIANHSSDVQDALSSLVETATAADSQLKEAGTETGENIVEGLVQAIAEDVTATDAVTTWSEDMMNAIHDATGCHSPSTITNEIGLDIGQGLVNGINSSAATYSKFYGWGANLIQGAINGINSKKSSYVKAMKDLAEAGNKAYKETNDINSPSKLYHKFTSYIIEGAVEGLEDNQRKYANAMADTANIGNSSFQTGKAVTSIPSATTTNNSSSTIVQLSYAPVLNGGSGDISSQLAQHDQKLIAMLEGYLSKREADQMRRAYA